MAKKKNEEVTQPPAPKAVTTGEATEAEDTPTTSTEDTEGMAPVEGSTEAAKEPEPPKVVKAEPPKESTPDNAVVNCNLKHNGVYYEKGAKVPAKHYKKFKEKGFID